MRLLASLLSALFAIGSGCGYALQSTSHSDALEREGVHKVYVAPVVNNTYKPGVENVVYNAMVRNLSTFSGLTFVRDKNDADAVLYAQVDQADMTFRQAPAVGNLNPAQDEPRAVELYGGVGIAQQYQATLICRFLLSRPHPGPGQRAEVWSASLSRQRPFPASNQLGVLGETSPLINDSEFDRSLQDASQDMMLDVREGILARF